MLSLDITKAFIKNFGVYNLFRAKVRALMKGLEMVRQQKVQNLTVISVHSCIRLVYSLQRKGSFELSILTSIKLRDANNILCERQ